MKEDYQTPALSPDDVVPMTFILCCSHTHLVHVVNNQGLNHPFVAIGELKARKAIFVASNRIQVLHFQECWHDSQRVIFVMKKEIDRICGS